jgi:hypothetical protein
MVMVCFVYVWKQLGYVCVLFTAGLQAIPPELFEAASLDGAGWWSRLQFRTAVDQLAKTRSQDSARVFVPGGDPILGKALESMVLNNGDPKLRGQPLPRPFSKSLIPK